MFFMQKEIKLIAFDIDGTLLNSQKELTERTLRALKSAAAHGIEVVPCTGRLLNVIPEVVRTLPFIRYAICVNGAQVVDCTSGETLLRAEIPFARALELLDALDKLPGIYDCYLDGKGWMSRDMWERFSEFASSERTLAFLRGARTPVPELRSFVRACSMDAQKLQIYFHTTAERMQYQPQLQAQFPELLMTSSLSNNLEINAPGASKGAALVELCRLLGFSAEHAMSFGDGTNDISMLKAASVGVAMANAEEQSVLDAADRIAPSCDEDGVAQVIEEMLRPEGVSSSPEG